MKSVRTLMAAGLVILATLGQAQADMGGNMPNRGTYDCADDAGELTGRFTFGGATSTLTIKGQPTSLECYVDADMETRLFFSRHYLIPTDICVGQAASGKVLIGTSKGMGVVQMHAFLLDARQYIDSESSVKAKAHMNCKPVQAKPGSGW